VPAGSGWVFEDSGTVALPMRDLDGNPTVIRRAFIRKDGDRQLTYYWFPQRGRVLTNMFQLKAYAFWDALTRVGPTAPCAPDHARLRHRTVAGRRGETAAVRAGVRPPSWPASFLGRSAGDLPLHVAAVRSDHHRPVPVFRTIAVPLDLVDLPGARKVHTQAMPRCGGIAMAIGAFVPVLLWNPEEPLSRGGWPGALIWLFSAWSTTSGARREVEVPRPDRGGVGRHLLGG